MNIIVLVVLELVKCSWPTHKKIFSDKLHNLCFIIKWVAFHQILRNCLKSFGELSLRIVSSGGGFCNNFDLMEDDI